MLEIGGRLKNKGLNTETPGKLLPGVFRCNKKQTNLKKNTINDIHRLPQKNYPVY